MYMHVCVCVCVCVCVFVCVYAVVYIYIRDEASALLPYALNIYTYYTREAL